MRQDRCAVGSEVPNRLPVVEGGHTYVRPHPHASDAIQSKGKYIPPDARRADALGLFPLVGHRVESAAIGAYVVKPVVVQRGEHHLGVKHALVEMADELPVSIEPVQSLTCANDGLMAMYSERAHRHALRIDQVGLTDAELLRLSERIIQSMLVVSYPEDPSAVNECSVDGVGGEGRWPGSRGVMRLYVLVAVEEEHAIAIGCDHHERINSLQCNDRADH